MDDKVIANDCLEAAKVSCTELTKAITECSNPQLRQTLVQLRNQAEQSQQQIYRIAEQNNWYMPAGPAAQDEISRVRSFFQSPQTGATQAGGQFDFTPRRH
jgi:spore coat protein CotF